MTNVDFGMQWYLVQIVIKFVRLAKPERHIFDDLVRAILGLSLFIYNSGIKEAL